MLSKSSKSKKLIDSKKRLKVRKRLRLTFYSRKFYKTFSTVIVIKENDLPALTALHTLIGLNVIAFIVT